MGRGTATPSLRRTDAPAVAPTLALPSPCPQPHVPAGVGVPAPFHSSSCARAPESCVPGSGDCLSLCFWGHLFALRPPFSQFSKAVDFQPIMPSSCENGSDDFQFLTCRTDNRKSSCFLEKKTLSTLTGAPADSPDPAPRSPHPPHPGQVSITGMQ